MSLEDQFTFQKAIWEEKEFSRPRKVLLGLSVVYYEHYEN